MLALYAFTNEFKMFSKSDMININRIKNAKNLVKLFHSSSPARLAEKTIKPKQVPFYTFVNPNAKKESYKERLYVWGYAGIGALGEPEFLEPTKSDNPILRVTKPWRLRWVDRNHAELAHIACGNGFSLFSVTNSRLQRGHALYGMGICTRSQVGVHETPQKHGEYYQYIIRPARIHLPFENENKVKILDLACGREHSIVLTDHGVVSFGSNVYGQCGRPIIEDESYVGNGSIIQNISKHIEMEDLTDTIESVKAGQDHTCFLTKQGRVLTCGWSSDGQTGQDVFTVCPVPKQVGGDLKNIKVTKISTKGDFVLALSQDGEVFGWGNNEYKQLSMCGSSEPQIGLPRHLNLPRSIKRPIKDIAAGGTSCLILDSNNQVWTWGYGLLGKGPKCQETGEPQSIPSTLFDMYEEIQHTMNKKVVSVNSGLFSSAVTLDDGTLYMWGKNRYGNLGTGDKQDAFMPLRVNIPARVEQIDCGPDHTFAICKANV